MDSGRAFGWAHGHPGTRWVRIKVWTRIPRCCGTGTLVAVAAATRCATASETPMSERERITCWHHTQRMPGQARSSVAARHPMHQNAAERAAAAASGAKPIDRTHSSIWRCRRACELLLRLCAGTAHSRAHWHVGSTPAKFGSKARADVHDTARLRSRGLRTGHMSVRTSWSCHAARVQTAPRDTVAPRGAPARGFTWRICSRRVGQAAIICNAVARAGVVVCPCRCHPRSARVEAQLPPQLSPC